MGGKEEKRVALERGWIGGREEKRVEWVGDIITPKDNTCIWWKHRREGKEEGVGREEGEDTKGRIYRRRKKREREEEGERG